jgi:multidrug efflux pump subunit AcrA (membrane-fusion protein)
MSRARNRRWLRLAVVAPVVCVIAGAAFVGAWATTKTSTPSATATTQLVQATVGSMSQTVSASGTIAPAATEDLNFTSGGLVTAVKVKAGQKVTKGQVLATIDSAALGSAVVQAQAQVAADAATLSTDQSGSASAAQITSDQANLSAAETQLASAQTALGGASLVSPINGQVASVSLTVGEQLGSNGASATSVTGSGASSPSTSTAEIEVVSTSLVVNLSVDDTEIAKIKAGQVATVSASSSTASSSNTNGGGGFGRFAGPPAAGANNSASNPSTNSSTNSTPSGTATVPTAAKVTSVGVIASATSGVATFPVVVRVTGAAAGLYSGATAAVTITYKQLDNVLSVPTLAVTQTNGQSYVTVSATGKTTKRAVTTGITSAGRVQITSGLKAGEQVVVTIPSSTTARGSNGGSNGGTGNAPTGRFFQGGGPAAGVGGQGQ